MGTNNIAVIRDALIEAHSAGKQGKDYPFTGMAERIERAQSPAGGDWVMVPRADLLELARDCNKSAITLGEIGLRGQCIEACNKINQMLAASPQQEPVAACPHIVRSKEGTSYCRLAESAGASGGGEKPVAWMVQKDGYYSFGPANSLHDHPGVVQAQKEGRLKLLVEWTPASPAAPQPQDSMQVIECGGCAPPVIATPARGAGEGEGDEDSVLAAVLNEQPFADRNDATRIWQMIDPGRDAREVLRAVVRIALTTRPAPEAQASGQTLAGAGDPLLKVLADLLDHVDRETCTHEEVHRGGAIWTICDSCGRKWADDEGGFVQHEDAPAVAAARAALTATSAGTTGDAELPEPAAYAVRESIGDNLWFFTTKRAEAHDNVGYKDSVEPLYTADQMREYARRAREVG